MTSSNGNISALLAICAGNSSVTSEFSAQRPVTRSFDIFFDLCLNKVLSKQSWVWWFESPLRPLWCHCNGLLQTTILQCHNSVHVSTVRLFVILTLPVWNNWVVAVNVVHLAEKNDQWNIYVTNCCVWYHLSLVVCYIFHLLIPLLCKTWFYKDCNRNCKNPVLDVIRTLGTSNQAICYNLLNVYFSSLIDLDTLIIMSPKIDAPYLWIRPLDLVPLNFAYGLL